MNKENNRSAAGLRRSAIAERIRLREEWSELKGTSDQNQPLTASNRQGRTRTLMKKQPVRNRFVTPGNSRTGIITNPETCTKSAAQIKEVLLGVVALVEVGTESRALPLRAALTALGATVVPAWTPIVTHVVWAQGGCRSTRARARALASRLVSPLWVEACAAAQRRLPELTFPAAARASDLPSPRTLRQLLKKAEMENIPLIDLLPDKDKEDGKLRLRLSSDSENDTSRDKSADTSRDTSRDTSHETTRDSSHNKTENRVNTAPRRALPISMSPARNAKSRRKLFTNREADDAKNKAGDESEEETVPRPRIPKPTPRARRELARAERMARRLLAAATTPAPATARSKRPRIVLTGMNKSERRAVTAAIQSLNGRIQNHVTRKTTHVILGSCRSDTDHCSGNIVDTSLRRSPRNKGMNITGVSNLNPVTPLIVHRSDVTKARTLNALVGAARGARVLTAQWAIESNAKGHYALSLSFFIGRYIKLEHSQQFNLDSVSNLNPVTPLIVHRSDVTKARTLNALVGAARGARVLTAQWVLDSKAKGHWLHPYGYEVAHLKKISERARIERNALGRTHSEYAYDVFNGMCVRVSPSAEQRDAATQLLKLCGAIVQDGAYQQDGGLQQDGGHDLTIGTGDGEVSSKWVFDSVAAARMRTTRRYVNNPLSNSLITQTQTTAR